MIKLSKKQIETLRIIVEDTLADGECLIISRNLNLHTVSSLKERGLVERCLGSLFGSTYKATQAGLNFEFPNL